MSRPYALEISVAASRIDGKPVPTDTGDMAPWTLETWRHRHWRHGATDTRYMATDAGIEIDTDIGIGMATGNGDAWGVGLGCRPGV